MQLRESGDFSVVASCSFLYSRPDHAQSQSSVRCVLVYITTPESRVEDSVEIQSLHG